MTLTIEPTGTGCTATLVHEMSAEWADYLARTEQGWARQLAAIEQFLQGQ